MSEWINNNSEWLSILFLFLSIPLGILTNIITPKVQKWLASQSKESVRKQIEQTERMIKLADRMIAKPSFAIAKFANMLLRAIMGYVGIALFLSMAVFFLSNPNLLMSTPTEDVPNSRTIYTILNLALFFLPGFLIMIITSRKTIELYAMTYWIEENEEWKQEKIKEIEVLKKKLSKFAA